MWWKDYIHLDTHISQKNSNKGVLWISFMLYTFDLPNCGQEFFMSFNQKEKRRIGYVNAKVHIMIGKLEIESSWQCQQTPAFQFYVVTLKGNHFFPINNPIHLKNMRNILIFVKGKKKKDHLGCFCCNFVSFYTHFQRRRKEIKKLITERWKLSN